MEEEVLESTNCFTFIPKLLDPFDTEICEIPITGRYSVFSFEMSRLLRCMDCVSDPAPEIQLRMVA